jgi:hypothetical protein
VKGILAGCGLLLAAQVAFADEGLRGDSGPGVVPRSVSLAPLPPVAPWTTSLSLLGGVADPFVGKAVLLGAVRRAFGAWGAEAFAGRAWSWDAPGLELCATGVRCRTPPSSSLRAVPGRLDWMGGAWAVLRGGGGKVSPSGSATWPVSTEAALGAAVVRSTWRDAREHADTAPALRWGLAAGIGLGGDVEIKAELGGLVYGARVRRVDTLERQLWLGAGLAWHPGGR